MTPKKLSVEARGDREIVITRDFNAPRALVWEAVTKPELVKRWLGDEKTHALVVCEIDLRVGGRYRYEWRGPNGGMALGGEYREIVPQQKIVNTEEWDEPWYPGEAVGTLTLTERGTKTTMTTVLRYASKEARDGVMKSPMESGLGGSYDRLENLLAEQPAAK